MANNRDYATKWGKYSAQVITRDRGLSGIAKKDNLDGWSKISTDNSFDQDVSKAQSRRDLAPVGPGPKDAVNQDYKIDASKTDKAYDWKHYSDLSRANSHTGRGGSRRGR